MLEALPDDVVYEDGKVSVKGSPDQAKTIQEIAGAAALGYSLPEGDEPFLDETAYFDPPNTTWPFGTHICVVEVEKETGSVRIKNYIAVDDNEVLESFHMVTKLEGIMPALETAHAFAALEHVAKNFSSSQHIVINVSGRGDKDINTVATMDGMSLD